MKALRDIVTTKAIEWTIVLLANVGGLKQAVEQPLIHNRGDFQEIVTTQTNPKDYHELKTEVTQTAIASNSTSPPDFLPGKNAIYLMTEADMSQIAAPQLAGINSPARTIRTQG